MKKISQETFDESVQDNIDMFDMDREEAIKESIEQFELMKVDITGISTHITAEEEAATPVVAAIDLLKDYAQFDTISVEDMIANLEIVSEQCADKDCQSIAGRNQAVTVVCVIMEKLNHPDSGAAQETVLALLSCFMALLKNSQDNKDRVSEKHAAVLCACARKYVDNTEVLTSAMKCICRSCVATETSKEAFWFEPIDIADLVLSSLRSFTSDKDMLLVLCMTVRCLVADDDMRTPASGAFKRGRKMAEYGAVPALLGPMAEYNEDPDVLSSLYATLNIIIINDSVAKNVRKEKGLAIIRKGFLQHKSHSDAARNGVSLLRSLAGNDDLKIDMLRTETLQAVVAVTKEHFDDEAICAQCAMFFAAVSLRQPDNVEALMKVGFAELIMNVMKTHAAHEETQRQCCHAIRNAVARDYKKEYVPKFVELGAEGAANNVTRRFPRCGDISRACVRDLGFEYEGSLVGRPAHELMHDAQTPENDGQTMTMDEAFSSLHGNAVQQGIEGMCT